MKFFFNAKLPDHGLHGALNAASIQGCINQMCIFQTPLPIRKKELWVPMDRPEIPQDLQSFFRQGDQPVLVPLGVADVDSHVGRIDIAGLQANPFSKTQTQRIGGKKENPVTQLARGTDQLLELCNRKNIRNPGGLWRFNQGDVLPCLAQHSGVKELQTIKIEFDSTPGTPCGRIVVA